MSCHTKPRQHAVFQSNIVRSTTIDLPPEWVQQWNDWNPVDYNNMTHQKQMHVSILRMLGLSKSMALNLKHSTFVHNLAVRKGASGAPIFTNNQIIGIHSKGHYTSDTNSRTEEGSGVLFSPLTCTILTLFRLKLISEHPSIKHGKSELFSSLRKSVATLESICNMKDIQLRNNKHFCPIRKI